MFIKPGRSLAFLLSPLMVLVLVLADPWDPTAVSTRYRVARAAAVQVSLMLLVPITALAGCWEGCRLRRGGIWSLPRTRPAWRVLLGPFLTCWLIPGLLLTATAVLRSSVDPTLLGSAWLHLAAWALIGLALGCTFSTVVALPLSLGVAAMWMILPAALKPLWVRHLNGAWEGCCILAQEPSWRAVLGGGLFALALTALAVCLFIAVVRHRPGWRWGAVMAFLVGGTVAAVTVMPMGASPGQPRTAARFCAGSPHLCLWPEHEDGRVRLESLLGSAAQRWRAKGVAVPEVFDEGGEPSASRVIVGVDPAAADASIVVRFATAVARAEQCPEAMGAGAEDVTRWLATAAGVSPDDVGNYLGPASGRSLSVADVNAHLARYRNCR